jgi:hypothetical protein
MKTKLTEHILSLALLSIIILWMIFFIHSQDKKSVELREEVLQPFLEQPFINVDDPFSKSLLKETLRLYTEYTPSRIDSIVDELQSFQTESFLQKGKSRHRILDPDNHYLHILCRSDPGYNPFHTF